MPTCACNRTSWSKECYALVIAAKQPALISVLNSSKLNYSNIPALHWHCGHQQKNINSNYRTDLVLIRNLLRAKYLDKAEYAATRQQK